MMKKIYILLLLLPVFGFSQVDFASWAFTANGNATSQAYITASYNAAGGNRVFSASGLLYGNNGHGGFQNYNYIEVAIKPTTGMVNVTSLNFSHARLANGVNLGSTNYTAKYYISAGETPSDSDFYTLGTTAVNDELITANPNKVIAINKTLTSAQKLIVRLYPRGGQWDNNAGWRINANTMKFKGTQLGPLAGTYYINSASTPNFASLSAAASAINALGMTAPVTFLLDNNTLNAASGETFPIVFNQFTGSSTTNTLTIKPNVGKTPTITATTSNLASVFKIDGGDNIIFDGSNTASGTSKDLTIANNGTSDISKTVLWIASNATNAATNIQVLNTIMSFGTRTADYRVLSGIFMGNTTTLSTDTGSIATAANSKITIQNNTFTNVLQGIYMTGHATSRTNDVTISSNLFGSAVHASKPAVGIQLLNIDNFNITDNILNGLRLASNAGYETVGGIFIAGSNTFNVKRNTLNDISFNQSNAAVMHGMQIKGVIQNGVVSENKITNVKNTGSTNLRALELDLDASTNSNLQVYNNVIADISAAGGNDWTLRGIYIANGKGIKLYHNSVVLTGTPGGSSISAALHIASGSAFDIRDNIFGNTSAGTPYAIYSSVASSAYTLIDYNDYFSSSNFGYLGGAINTITAWRTATGKDVNSLKATPSFSTTDLRLTYPNATNATLIGTSLISADIDATVRTIPTMGAYEYRLVCSGSTVTWSGTAWNNVTGPISTSRVNINGNYNTATNGNINACELTVQPNRVLTIAAGGVVKVENGITTSGTGSIVIENNGSLIQVDPAASAASPGLNVTVIRKSTTLKQNDYTYWSSPVQGATLSTVSAPSIFYEFNTMAGTAGQWANLSWAYIMLPGSGYIARAPATLDWTSNPSVTATFSGRVNSGTINKTIYKNTASGSNLVGNPYPSALDADAFILANQANITGSLYFWTHSTAISGQAGQVQNYTKDDYAVYTLTGSTGTRGNLVNGVGNGAKRPNGQIASGQAFFVDALNNNANLQFTNAMRTGGDNTQFFRSAPQVRTESGPIEKSRVWLTLTNTEGAYSETLVGYIEGATNGLDNIYDAVKYDGGNYVSLYSMIGDETVAIQGKALPFTATDIVPLGYKTTIAGTFKISLDEFDGLFGGQDVYLFDNATNILTKLNDGAYTFTTAIGTFNTRFELRFTNGTLGIDQPVANPNQVVVFTKGNGVEIQSQTQQIKSLVIYDLLGRSLYSNEKIDATTFATKQLGFQSQVVVVKVRMADNTELTKKLILK